MLTAGSPYVIIKTVKDYDENKQSFSDVNINEADLLIMATDDEDYNIILALMAKRIFSVPKVLASVSQQYVGLLKQFGIDAFVK